MTSHAKTRGETVARERNTRPGDPAEPNAIRHRGDRRAGSSLRRSRRVFPDLRRSYRTGRRHHRGLVRALGAAAVAAGATAWVHPGIGHNPPPAPQSAIGATANTLAPLLEQVRIVDRISPVAGYERGCQKSQRCVYGPAWNDPDNHSGCDTRSRLLASSLRNVEFKPGTHNCKPIAGTLDPDPYTGQAVDLTHVEADHIYPLHRSWDAGAWQWNSKQRQTFANDLTELIAVSDQANRAKSDAGLDGWLPSYHPCDYIQHYLTVAIKYQLPITTAERSAAVNTCRITTGPGQLLAKA